MATLIINNISQAGGKLGLTNSGAISQTAYSAISVAGSTQLVAGGALTLDSAGNDFGVQLINDGVTPNVAGMLSASGSVISLRDKNDLTLGAIGAGAVTLTAGKSILNGNVGADSNITATISAALSAGSVIGTTAKALTVNVPTVTVYAGGTDAGLTSVNISGVVGDDSVHFVSYPPGSIRFNDRYIYIPSGNGVLADGIGSQVYPVTLVAAQQLAYTDNASMLPSMRLAEAAMLNAYPTDNIKAQINKHGSVVGMLEPMIKISGSGMTLLSGMNLEYTDEIRTASK